MNVTLSKDALGRMLICAFERGAAYGADGIRPDIDQTKREATLDLFCDAIPGWEESTAKNREADTQARDLLRTLPDAPQDGWANLTKEDKDTVLLALTTLVNYAKNEQSAEAGMGPAYRAAMQKAEAETLATLRKLDPEVQG